MEGHSRHWLPSKMLVGHTCNIYQDLIKSYFFKIWPLTSSPGSGTRLGTGHKSSQSHRRPHWDCQRRPIPADILGLGVSHDYIMMMTLTCPVWRRAGRGCHSRQKTWHTQTSCFHSRRDATPASSLASPQGSDPWPAGTGGRHGHRTWPPLLSDQHSWVSSFWSCYPDTDLSEPPYSDCGPPGESAQRGGRQTPVLGHALARPVKLKLEEISHFKKSFLWKPPGTVCSRAYKWHHSNICCPQWWRKTPRDPPRIQLMWSMTREDKLLCPGPAWSISAWLWSQSHRHNMLSTTPCLRARVSAYKTRSDLSSICTRHLREALFSLMMLELGQQSDSRCDEA